MWTASGSGSTNRCAPTSPETMTRGNWAHDRYLDYLQRDLNIGELGGRPAMLTEPGLFHADYSIVQPVQDTVHPPVPYATLDDENTYSPGRTDPTGAVTVPSGPATRMGEYDRTRTPSPA